MKIFEPPKRLDQQTKAWGADLKHEMRKAGVIQRSLAIRLDVSVLQVQRWMRGLDLVKKDQAREIGKALGFVDGKVRLFVELAKRSNAAHLILAQMAADFYGTENPYKKRLNVRSHYRVTPFGKLLVRLRFELGLTSKIFATRFETTSSFLARVIDGRSDIPNDWPHRICNGMQYDDAKRAELVALRDTSNAIARERRDLIKAKELKLAFRERDYI